MYIASKDIKMAFGVAGPKHVADILGGQKVCGWIAAAQSREMKGLEGDTAFKNVESKFNLTRCNRQGSVEAPTLRLKSARLILWHVEMLSIIDHVFCLMLVHLVIELATKGGIWNARLWSPMTCCCVNKFPVMGTG